MSVFWNVATCSFLHHQGALMIEAVRTSETSISFYKTAPRNTSEDSRRYTRHRQNLKSHLFTKLCILLVKRHTGTLYSLQKFLSHKIKVDKMGATCNMHRGKEKFVHFNRKAWSEGTCWRNRLWGWTGSIGSGWGQVAVSSEHGKELVGSIKDKTYLDQLRNYQLLKAIVS
jgi:hypothetical protein